MSSLPFVMDVSIMRKLLSAALFSLAILAATALATPDRAWANFLLVAFYLVTLGLGGVLFMALAHVCGASWHVAFRRVPEALAGLLSWGSLLILAALVLRLHGYSWHHHGPGDAGSFWFKELWLSPMFFAVRAIVIVALWNLLARILVNQSRQQDRLSVVPGRRVSTVPSVLFLVLFAVSISVAGADWIMALEPMWFSTIWGVYQFSGLIQAALAVMIITGILLRRKGPLRGTFTTEHLHDLGKLLMGFSCFWMYIWFSQYMLIWYSNIPEETSYFIRRMHSPWAPVVVSSLVLNWGIPFFVLLPRPCKRHETIMLRVAVLVLIGRWVDLSVMIFPAVTGPMPLLGLPELAGLAAIASGTGYLVIRAFSAASAVPRNDPDLAASLQYHA